MRYPYRINFKLETKEGMGDIYITIMVYMYSIYILILVFTRSNMN